MFVANDQLLMDITIGQLQSTSDQKLLFIGNSLWLMVCVTLIAYVQRCMEIVHDYCLTECNCLLKWTQSTYILKEHILISIKNSHACFKKRDGSLIPKVQMMNICHFESLIHCLTLSLSLSPSLSLSLSHKSTKYNCQHLLVNCELKNV